MTLYEQLGDENLKLLIDDFYNLVFSDDRINHLFKNDINEIKTKQFKFLTQFLGGPPRYSEAYGHPRMRMRHMPHAITKDAAVAWLENMNIAIHGLDIPEQLKRELFARFPHVAGHMVNA